MKAPISSHGILRAACELWRFQCRFDVADEKEIKDQNERRVFRMIKRIEKYFKISKNSKSTKLKNCVIFEKLNKAQCFRNGG